MTDNRPNGLTEEQLAAYRRDGYTVLESFFSRAQLDNIDRVIEEIAETAIAGGDYSKTLELERELADGKPVVRRLYNPFDIHPAFSDLATDARLLDCVQSVIGPNFGLQHSKLNMKPAKVGSIVEWHQDLAYFPHTNDDLITLLIYLDDATEENGCLQVLPRHHTHYFDHSLPDGAFAGMITEEVGDGRFGQPVSLPAPAGSIIFMHCITPHSSLPNRSSKPRRTLIFEYRAADSFPIYYGQATTQAEAKVRPLRGKPAQFARFGGPPPVIPNYGRFASLYALQEDAKEKLAAK